MNKNLLLFFSLFLIVPFSSPLNAMDGADHKGAETPSPSGNLKKQKNRKPKNDGAQAAAGAGAGLVAAAAPVSPLQMRSGIGDDTPSAREYARMLDALKSPSPGQAAQAEDNSSVVEIELNPTDTKSFLQQKATNYVLGTHTTLLTRLRALQPNEIVSKSLANQSVILSAVKNLVELCGTEYCVLKKASLDDIAELLKWAETRRSGKPVITLDKGPADALKEFLDLHQKKLFAAFYASYLEQIKPVNQIAGLVDAIDRIGGKQPSGDVNLTSLTHANMQALDKIMRDMAGQKPAAQDAKDQS